jgi:hypothetical protein
MNEQIVRMGVMWIMAGLSAGWLAETLIVRRGYGLIVDMTLGVGAGLVGGGVFLMVSGGLSGMLAMFVSAFVLAAGAIVAQRLFWPRTPAARERNAQERLRDLRGRSRELHGVGNGVIGRPAPAGALLRVATTGNYRLPLELQRAARSRAVNDGTTLREVMLEGLGEYAAGTWTPKAGDKRSAA